MAIPNMSDEQMRRALKELEQAAYNHEQWSEMIFSTLICRLTPDQRDISSDAHRHCRFGQWYYNSGFAALEDHPGFSEIAAEHEHMHQFGASLLRSSMEGLPISTGEYDRFVTAMKQMRLELATIQQEFKEALSNLDPLTGTPSRTGMLTRLREHQEMVRRNIHTCTIAMMDLDHFKAVNDKYGHLAGDRVLIDSARSVAASLRLYDKVFRYGGEEFLICLPDTDLQDGRNIVDRLREGDRVVAPRVSRRAGISRHRLVRPRSAGPRSARGTVHRPRRQGSLCSQGAGPKSHGRLGAGRQRISRRGRPRVRS